MMLILHEDCVHASGNITTILDFGCFIGEVVCCGIS
jgi:hypothetical protein